MNTVPWCTPGITHSTGKQKAGRKAQDPQMYLYLDPYLYLGLESGFRDIGVIPYNPVLHTGGTRVTKKSLLLMPLVGGGGAEEGLSCETVYNAGQYGTRYSLGMYGDISSQPTQASPASIAGTVLYCTLLHLTMAGGTATGHLAHLIITLIIMYHNIHGSSFLTPHSHMYLTHCTSHSLTHSHMYLTHCTSHSLTQSHMHLTHCNSHPLVHHHIIPVLLQKLGPPPRVCQPSLTAVRSEWPIIIIIVLFSNNELLCLSFLFDLATRREGPAGEECCNPKPTKASRADIRQHQPHR